jgi:hypothetical protein
MAAATNVLAAGFQKDDPQIYYSIATIDIDRYSLDGSNIQSGG